MKSARSRDCVGDLIDLFYDVIGQLFDAVAMFLFAPHETWFAEFYALGKLVVDEVFEDALFERWGFHYFESGGAGELVEGAAGGVGIERRGFL